MAEARMRDKIPLPAIDPDTGTKLVVEQMLFSLQKWDGSAQSDKIAGIYKEYTGARMRKGVVGGAMLFRGMGGHGKTSCIVDAFKIFCKLTGMNPVTELNDPSYRLTKNDAVLNTVHAAGATSSIEFQLPVVHEDTDAEGNKIKYVMSLPERSFAVAPDAGFYMLYLDDFLCTNSDMQNMWMNVIQQKQYKGMRLGEDSFVLASGNLGYDDDSYVTEPSLPMKGRFPGGMYYMEETVKGFSNRMNKKYGALDSIGDAGLVEFIERNPKWLTMEPEDRTAREENMSQPRGLEASIQKLRVYFGKVEDGVEKISENQIFLTVLDQIGPVAGKEVSSHLINLTTGVALVAKDVISYGKLSEKVNDEYSKFIPGGKKDALSSQKIFDTSYGGGSHPKADAFAYQLVDALSREAASTVAQNGRGHKDNPQVYANFSTGIALLGPQIISYAFHRFGWRLQHAEGFAKEDGRPGLHVEEKTLITKAATIALGSEVLNQVSESLTGVSAFKDRPKSTTSIGKQIADAAAAAVAAKP